ncbi:MAG: hypothetical protein ISS47_04580, partial [Candidatus Omnitrophica bacterium]|nr:hypothetical protein [Candidatus Omnitrophota bacterium]
MIKKPNIDTIVILVVGIVTILFCLPLFKNIHYLSTNDEWFNAFTFNHFSRICILKYHQLPLWSPFSGGGFPIIGRAYLGFLSPLFTFVLIFGEVVGLKVVVLVIYLAAATG